MPEEWPLVALADVTEQRRTSVRVGAGRTYPLLGVRWYGEGPFLREVVTSASSKATRLFEVHADDFIYNRLFAYKGSFGRVPHDLAGSFVSNEFPLFTCGAGVLDPRFLELYFQQPSVWSLVEQESVGTTASRSRWKEETFARHRIALPPLEVQRRIVDLIGAIDANVEALATEAAAGADTEGPLIETLLARGSEGAQPVPLGEVGEFVRGRRFTKDEYVPTGLGCIHYGQIHTHFGSVARKSLTFLPEESRSRLRLARPGDVVIAATSEDVEGLGKATVWLGDDDVAVHDDCYIFRHRLDPKFASYVFASPWFQHQKKQYAGGTKVTRISGSDLARIAIPIPPIAVQRDIGEALGALSDHVSAVRVELETVRQLRTSTLTALLSQRFEIPETFDQLLDVGEA